MFHRDLTDIVGHSLDVQHCIVRFEPPPTSMSSKSSTPVHLRSTRIPLPKTHLAPKITSILAELGVSNSRLVMPTRANIERLENLQTAAASLLEMKKNVDRVEQEIRVLQAQSMRGSEVPSAVGGPTGGDDDSGTRGSAGPSSGGVQKLLDKRAVGIRISARSFPSLNVYFSEEAVDVDIFQRDFSWDSQQ